MLGKTSSIKTSANSSNQNSNKYPKKGDESHNNKVEDRKGQRVASSKVFGYKKDSLKI